VLIIVQGDLLLPSMLAGYYEEEVTRRAQGYNAGKAATKLALPGTTISSNKLVDALVPTFTPLNELSGVVDHDEATPESDREQGTQCRPIALYVGDVNVSVCAGAGATTATGNRAASVFCPAILGALVLSAYHFIVSVCSTDFSRTLITAEIILTRSFSSLYNRKKLILGCMFLHLMMACFLGWVLGPSSDQAYNLVSFFAVGTLMLYFANLQLVYYMFTHHQVNTKHDGRDIHHSSSILS
jgi:hypothetical protein